MPSQDSGARCRWERGRALSALVVGLAVALALTRPCTAAVIECAAEDVACLITAVNTANASGGATIQLQAGTYSLKAPDNSNADGPNGLPSITSVLTIVGAGVGTTIIERDATAPDFRLLHVAANGRLKLERLTARGGHITGQSPGGAGILNRGTVILSQSALTDCRTQGIDAGGGGGIVSAGPVIIAGSTIARNSAGGFGGGISTSGVLTIVDSTISDNRGNIGGGLFIGGQSTTIIGSTIANNIATDGKGGGVFSSSTVAIINTTLTGNFTNFGGGGLVDSGGGGIIINTTIANNETPSLGETLSGSGALAVYNTIVSGRPALNQPACLGPVTSLGNNLFSDGSCGVLLGEDLTGDPRLGDFTDDGTPGHGFLPLLRRSPALNAADPGACLPTDQRGHKRTAKGCDIGAIEGTRP